MTRDEALSDAMMDPTAATNAPPAGHVLFLDESTSGLLSSRAGVNTGGIFSEKTIAISFETGANVVDRQVIFEQGGGWRGLNVYIENGMLHMAAWTVRGGDEWGFKKVSTPIQANMEFNASLLFDGESDHSGSLSGFLNGSQFGVVEGVGLLQPHNNAIGVGQVNGQTVIDGRVTSATSEFQGTVKKVVQYNEVLSEGARGELDAYLGGSGGEPPAAGPSLPDDVQMFLTEPEFGKLANSSAINTARSYTEKTLAITFETGDDVDTRQVIYEQGGGARGIAVFVEDGELKLAVWNFREERWGYRDLSVEIEAGQSYSTTLLFDGVRDGSGSITGFLDGVEFGVATGVGVLYRHPDGVGVGGITGQTVLDGKATRGDFAFQGEIDAIVSYNRLLSDAELDALNAVMSPTPTPDPEPAPEPIPVAPPSPEDDAAAMSEGGVAIIDALANDADYDDDASDLVIESVTQPRNGQVVITEDGKLSYTHDGGESRTDSFTYTVRNSDGLTSTATVTVEIANANDAPVLTVADIVVSETAAVGDVIGQVSAQDTDSDTLVFALADPADREVFSIDAETGEIRLDAPLDYDAQSTHVIEVQVDDGQAVTTQALTATVEREDRPNVVAIIDTGYLSNAREYHPLIDEWNVNLDQADASSPQNHGTIVEKSVWDVTQVYDQQFGAQALDGVIHIRLTNDSTTGVSSFRIHEAFQFVETIIDDYDVVAVNLSYGHGVFQDERIATSSFADEYETLTENGTAITVAAGNSRGYGTNYFGSTSMDGVYTVSALNTNGTIASYTNEGDFTDYYAVGRTNWGLETDASDGRSAQGTSFAAPRVAGLVAVAQDMAEESLGRLLDIDELTQVFDNVQDTVTGRRTGEEIITLDADNVIASFIEIYGDEVEAAGSDAFQFQSASGTSPSGSASSHEFEVATITIDSNGEFEASGAEMFEFEDNAINNINEWLLA